jgi:hypothetical protein
VLGGDQEQRTYLRQLYGRSPAELRPILSLALNSGRRLPALLAPPPHGSALPHGGEGDGTDEEGLAVTHSKVNAARLTVDVPGYHSW